MKHSDGSFTLSAEEYKKLKEIIAWAGRDRMGISLSDRGYDRISELREMIHKRTGISFMEYT